MSAKVVHTNGYVHRGTLLLLPTAPPPGFSHGDLITIMPRDLFERLTRALRACPHTSSWFDKEAAALVAEMTGRIGGTDDAK